MCVCDVIMRCVCVCDVIETKMNSLTKSRTNQDNERSESLGEMEVDMGISGPTRSLQKRVDTPLSEL